MSEVFDEKECYGYLLAGILRQTIADYVISRRALQRSKQPKSVGFHEGRVRSCERFFKDPPYDYGDIDFVLLKKLCEEKAKESGRIYVRPTEVKSLDANNHTS